MSNRCLCKARGLGVSFVLCLLGGRFLSFSERTHKTSNLEINVPFYNALFLFNRVKMWPTLQWFSNGTLTHTGTHSELRSPDVPVPRFIRRSENNSASSLNKTTSTNSSLKEIQETCCACNSTTPYLHQIQILL